MAVREPATQNLLACEVGAVSGDDEIAQLIQGKVINNLYAPIRRRYHVSE